MKTCTEPMSHSRTYSVKHCTSSTVDSNPKNPVNTSPPKLEHFTVNPMAKLVVLYNCTAPFRHKQCILYVRAKIVKEYSIFRGTLV